VQNGKIDRLSPFFPGKKKRKRVIKGEKHYAQKKSLKSTGTVAEKTVGSARQEALRKGGNPYRPQKKTEAGAGGRVTYLKRGEKISL